MTERTIIIFAAIGLTLTVIVSLFFVITAEPADSKTITFVAKEPDSLKVREIDVNLSDIGIKVITFRDEWGRECTLVADSKTDMITMELDCEDLPR